MSNIEQRASAERTALEELEKKLKQLGTLHPFPEDGAERHAELTERIAPLREKTAELKHRIDSEIELAEKIKKDPLLRLDNDSQEISRIEKLLASVSGHEARLHYLEDDISKKNEDLFREIRKIAPNWINPPEKAESNLKSAVTSQAVLHQAEQMRAELARIEAEIKDTELNVKNEKLRRHNLEEELTALRKKSDSMPAESIDALQSDILGLRENFLRRREISAELGVMFFARKEFLRKIGDVDDSSPLGEMNKIMMFAFAFSCALAFLSFTAFGHSVLIIVLCLFFFVPSFALYRKAIVRERARIDRLYKDADVRDRFFDSIEGRIIRLEKARDETEMNMSVYAHRLQIQNIDKIQSIEALAEQLDSSRVLLKGDVESDMRDRRFELLINDTRSKQVNYERNKIKLISKMETLFGSWAEWLGKMNFPTTVRPENFDVFILNVNAAKDKLEIINSVRREVQSEKDFIKSVHDSAQNLCLKLRTEKIETVFKSLQEAPALKARLDKINDNIARASSERRACDEMIAKYAAEVRELFASSGVGTEREFKELAAAWDEHWILEANIAERRRNLSILNKNNNKGAGSDGRVDE